MVMTGVKNHYMICIFACILLLDESVETYNWLLETFFEAMWEKKPCSVVTDGDRTVRKETKKVIRTARHRQCYWHLKRNARSNLCNNEFTDWFYKCMLQKTPQEKFEKDWKDLVC